MKKLNEAYGFGTDELKTALKKELDYEDDYYIVSELDDEGDPIEELKQFTEKDSAIKYADSLNIPACAQYIYYDEATGREEDDIIYYNKEAREMRLNESLTEDKETCVLCGEEIEGYGNNPAPLADEGKCCDSCNSKRVIPARLKAMKVNKMNEDVKKLPNGKYANVGKDGKANSGKFKTKKAADAQRKAMFANGYKESIIRYPNGMEATDVDLDRALDYQYGTDRDKDNSKYTDDEKQRAVTYWIKKTNPSPYDDSIDDLDESNNRDDDLLDLNDEDANYWSKERDSEIVAPDDYKEESLANEEVELFDSNESDLKKSLESAGFKVIELDKTQDGEIYAVVDMRADIGYKLVIFDKDIEGNYTVTFENSAGDTPRFEGIYTSIDEVISLLNDLKNNFYTFTIKAGDYSRKTQWLTVGELEHAYDKGVPPVKVYDYKGNLIASSDDSVYNTVKQFYDTIIDRHTIDAYLQYNESLNAYNESQEESSEKLDWDSTIKVLKQHLSKIPKGAMSRANIRDVLVAYCNYSSKEANDFVAKLGVSGVRNLIDESLSKEEVTLTEDTVKKSNGKWTNRGKDGKEHGEFDTKKQADAQRRAMYANGYKGESLEECDMEPSRRRTSFSRDREGFKFDDDPVIEESAKCESKYDMTYDDDYCRCEKEIPFKPEDDVK